MLSKIREFFQENIAIEEKTANVNESGNKVAIATCALLLEMAHTDEEFSEIEEAEIKKIMQSEFNLAEDKVDAIIKLSDEEMEMREKLHMLPPEKKAALLKKLGAMGADKLQQVADKLGMTKIQLKQMLGRDVAENSLGNLSFSDYHDPDVPYEAKPRTNIGFQYGTPF